MKGFFADIVDMAGTSSARSAGGSGATYFDTQGAEALPPHKTMLKGRALADQCLEQRHTLLEIMRVLGQVSLTLEMLHAAGTLSCVRRCDSHCPGLHDVEIVEVRRPVLCQGLCGRCRAFDSML
jgi:hypothetical protein